MALFKHRVRFLYLLGLAYLFFSFQVSNILFSCTYSRERKPTGPQVQKIKQAILLFTTKPKNIAEPVFLIKGGQCYNAWADSNASLIIISQRIIDEFSTKDLAGILGHEFGHLILSSKQVPVRKQMQKHWEVDIIGAELTSKQTMIGANERQIYSYNQFFKEHKMLKFTLPLVYRDYIRIVTDYELRNNKVGEKGGLS